MDDKVFDSTFRPLDYGGPCEEDSYGNMIDDEEILRKRFEKALNQEFSPTIPGVNTPLEIQMRDGRNFVVPPQQPMTTQPNTYTPGGVTTMQGGFNPLTGMIEPTISYQGFSYDPLMGGHQIPNTGYASYEAYPSYASPYSHYYQQQVDRPSYGPPAVMTADSPNGFMPYYPGCHQSPNSPYYTGPYPQQQPYQYIDPWQERIQNFYRTQHLYQNSCNDWWREVLYDENVSGLDIRTVVSEIIPHDEIKEKMNREYSLSNGYYNSWEASRLAQAEYEKHLEEQKQIILRWSKITHTYLNDGYDEEYIKRVLYPEPPKVFNPITATKEEKAEYDKILKQQETDRLIENIKMQRQAREQARAMFPYFIQQIKESHDKVLGIQPGQRYDLKYFCENGYKLVRQVAMQKAKQAQRDGTRKYNQNYYRANLSTVNKRPIPINSKDNECVSLTNFSSRLQRSSNLQPTKLDGIMKDEYGNLVYVGIPVDASEREAHEHFLEQLGYKKRESDARKAVR